MSIAAQIDDLSFAHPGTDLPALEGVSLRVPAGESVALLGPSGAGKTTLLALLDGRLQGWSGRVSVLGAPLDPDHPPPRARRPDTGFVFQEFALVERSTVLRNVLNGRLGRMSPLRALFGSPTAHDLEIARAALTDCGIADLAERRVDSLSGGQRQRVAIARCLAQEPLLILADEPVSNLDPARACEILALLTGAAQARGATALFSSHQPDLARRFAQRIIGIRGGQIAFDVPTSELNEDATAELYREVEPIPGISLRAVS
ncbi:MULTISPECIES: phosphonate ABC transporter ATP-binding protein [Rhodobacterales]|jgi:phosphonate transport system ATP-binding protein|uniref:phosphonate ABC transporter ATP-binding protein n=1 Tax=Rhodobacterales TaxID=204455 RepID=UPI0013D30FFF|nr:MULTISPECIES: ATP-binding cassette domain-containing protein [Rhodobacterales]MCG7629667.1 ATP-binding cassette domain-containing protein [Epibacterium sp. MM17-32]